MRLATILSLGASALLGVGALFVARVWLPGAEAAEQAPVATVPIVAAASAIPYGTKLEAKHLTIVRLPPDTAPEGAYGSIAQVVALDGGAPVTLSPLAAREPLLPSKLSGAGAKPSLAAAISPGMRAYTIRVSEVAGGGGHVLPGDRVDVVLARQLGQDNAQVVADVVLQNVRVLGMNLNADPNSTDKTTPKTATLEVSVEDAGRLSIAAEVGLLSLALRRTGAAEVEPVRPIAVRDLRVGGAPSPRPARTVVRRAAPAAAPATRGVTVVHGDQRTVVSVPRSGAGA